MKKVLIICYYWPPAGGPGVQRWLKFVKYFRNYGIEPVVYVPEQANYPIIDQTFEKEIPFGIEIIKRPINEPYKYAQLFSKNKIKKISSGVIQKQKPSLLEKAMLFIRGNFFIPDARVYWVKPSVRYLSSYLQNHPEINTIITSGPPHSLHLIGLNLKKKQNLKWIADFRDPWTTIHYHQSLRLTKKSEKKHIQLEKKVLDNATIVVVTSPSTKKEFQKISSTPIHVITNGYDFSKNETIMLDTFFSLGHIGSLLSERNPAVLWKVLAELCEEVIGFKKDLKLQFAGIVAPEVLKSIQEAGIEKNLELSGYVSHQEALQFQQKAQILLLIEMNKPETRAIIPGKLFEYFASQRPIIALGPEGSDVALLLEETRAGVFFNYDDEKLLKEQLLIYYKAYKTESLKVGGIGIESYSRTKLTEKMAQLIKTT